MTMQAELLTPLLLGAGKLSRQQSWHMCTHTLPPTHPKAQHSQTYGPLTKNTPSPTKHAGERGTAVALHKARQHTQTANARQQHNRKAVNGALLSGVEQQEGNEKPGAWWLKRQGKRDPGGEKAGLLPVPNSLESKQSTASKPLGQGKSSQSDAPSHTPRRSQPAENRQEEPDGWGDGEQRSSCSAVWWATVFCVACRMWHSARTVVALAERCKTTMGWVPAKRSAKRTASVQGPNTGDSSAGDRRAAHSCVRSACRLNQQNKCAGDQGAALSSSHACDSSRQPPRTVLQQQGNRLQTRKRGSCMVAKESAHTQNERPGPRTPPVPPRTVPATQQHTHTHPCTGNSPITTSKPDST